ncbi:MAG: type II toxin-antitoxin system RelE/ParE family toxin [Rickettsiales bacterium]|jgi:mRNA-degrading endonuclease RelE of RelBE toxin-antitoxin system|nr:type II toxin-antitoxin system RelE/ParE family toxin [Rickettsiales bacterium]
MILKKTNSFEKTFKKLHQNQREDVLLAIETVVTNPDIGEKKIGDLDGVRVYKFKIVNQLALLAYEFNSDEIMLLSLGSHQNFYENLKRK